MWGRFYWAKNGAGAKRGDGIVVLFAWPSSQESQLKSHVDLYWSLGWDCLICHVDFVTQFFPKRSIAVVNGIFGELIKEIKIGPLPIVLAVFSVASKCCFYKFLQLVEGQCEGQQVNGCSNFQDDYRLLRDCICGQMYDSSPVEFTNDLKLPDSPRVVSWVAKAFTSALDALLINKFEVARAEYWQTLYSSVSIGPFLILCSEDDELTPYKVVQSFAQRLQELGADVSILKWRNSPHVAHYKNHQCEYRDAVTKFLGKASLTYSRRRLHRTCRNKIPESVCNLHKAAYKSNESFKKVAVDPSDHFFLPSSVELNETRNEGSSSPIDEQKQELFRVPSIKPQGVLSQILFDVCIPKNIEGWDIKPISSLNKSCGHLNPVKSFRRSRL
ncbi:hypothetical protein AXF42_Ash015593 [Apostasia shenzhenica]|uniref:Uncharacterized protein n=1 Tax=Apostasia shenzhenica TaxID=1088818 RepID=A0A2I0AKM8_9ASPA|nr:hypothetical protein AXF42_Ash015593 [Apostasia shenzhenica]